MSTATATASDFGAASRSTGAERSDAHVDQYLAFSIEEESYGIDIARVTEIIGLQRCTEVPDVPGWIRGVINLRGKVIPIMDVRKRFGLSFREDDDRTCIVVVQVGEEQVGLVVDRVQEVMDLPHGSLDQNRSEKAASYVRGMAHVEGRVLIVLDIDEVLGVND